MKAKNTEQLGTESVGRLMLRLSMPAIAAQVINLLYNMVDRMYIGRIPGDGRLAFTGVGVCLSVIMILSAFAALVSMGGAPRAAIFLGKGDKQTAERIMGNCAALLMIVSAVLTAVLVLFNRDILLLFGASENTIGFATDYMGIYGLGTVFVLGTLGLNAFITAQGFSGISMCTVLIGALLNIALDPIFIFALGMGVRGAALATIISQGVSFVWVLLFLTGKKTTLRLKPKNLRISAKIALPCVALGLSPFIMQSTESLIQVCFNTSLLEYGGDLAVGAMVVLTSVMQLSMLPLAGLSQGAQPIVSYNFGAAKPERVKKAFRLLLTCCLAYSVTIWAAVMLFPGTFVTLFNSDPELVVFGSRALRIYMSAGLLLGAQIACQQTFIAIGNAPYSLFLAVLRKILLLLPLIYILPMFIQNKTDAVFLAEPVADIIAVSTTVILFTVQFKKAMKTLGQASMPAAENAAGNSTL